ncbi:MAG TPA: hypothetical protein PLI09_06770 [Candidatus Hydrogenedentes bacterium]|nr:hypothetical protein [Candidatus Hydrogenedentota bacterium]
MKLASVLMYLFILAGSHESNIDSKAFLGEGQVFSIDGKVCIIPAPNANKVAVVSREECSFFELSADRERWAGPFASGQGLDFHIGDEWPPFWVCGKNGKEFLVLDQQKEVGVCLENGRMISGVLQGTDKPDVCEPETGRLRRPLVSFRNKDKEQIQKLLSLLKNNIRNTPPDQKTDTRKKCESAEQANIYELYDISRKNTSILCRLNSEAPLISLELKSDKRISFPIERHPQVLDSDMHGSYSPNGEWVLIQYSYGPDDHYSGGYLQLFDKDGHYILEIAKFYNDVTAPVGHHFWLYNNWIVYSDGHNLVFRKFLK